MLGVSPVTVASAYRDLRRRGVVTAAGRRGTRVSGRPPVSIAAAARPGLPKDARDQATGNPDPDLLPSLASALASVGPSPRLYGSPPKLESLAELARRRFEADGIAADHLAFAGGGLDGIERVLAAHLRPGDTVVVENPGYARIFDLLRGAGFELDGVSCDDFGPLPDDLDRALRRASAVILTPRAQNPTGAALDRRRVRELRAVLSIRPEAFIVEDDHADAIAGVPALTVCNRDRSRYAVVRSVSKTLGPDLRFGVIGGDAETIARMEGRQSLGAGWVSGIIQQLAVNMWSDPSVDQLLSRAAHTYTTRRTALIDALAERGISAHGRSGLNVWIPVPEEAAVVSGLLERGWAVAAGERWRLETIPVRRGDPRTMRTPPAIRVTAATLAAQDARRFADDLAGVLVERRYSA